MNPFTPPRPHFKENAARALDDAQLQKALGNVQQGFIDKRADGGRQAAGIRGAARLARATSRTTRSQHLDLYLEAYEEKVTASGGHVHFARTARGSARHHPRHLPRGRREDGHQGQVDDRRGDRAQRPPRSARHHAGRDRPRRVHHPAAQRAAEPHHRAGRPPQRDAGGGGFPPRPHPSRRRARSLRAGAAAHRSARRAARALPRGRCRHHRRELPVAETGTSIIVTNEGNGDLTQILPKIAHRPRLDREARADAGGRQPDPARAGPLGDRAGDVGLHHLLDRPAPSGRSGRARELPRRHPRQRPLGHARHELPGHAALHPLRRLHEPLPGLSCGRRARLWLGLSRPDGRGADARP